MLEERVGGVTKAHYVWSPVYVNALVLRDRDATGGGSLNERLYVQQDANWNVTALVSTSGAVAERYIDDPYGTQTVLTAGWSVQSGSAYGFVYGFQGLRLEAAAGIWYARWRDLSPTLMRFLQPDPIHFGAGDVDFYRYEGNGPTSVTDEFGLQIARPGPVIRPPPAPPGANPRFEDPTLRFPADNSNRETSPSRRGGVYIQGKLYETLAAEARRVGVPEDKIRAARTRGHLTVPGDYTDYTAEELRKLIKEYRRKKNPDAVPELLADWIRREVEAVSENQKHQG